MDLHGLAGHPLGGLAHVRLEQGGLEAAFTPGDLAGDVVGELPGALDGGRHAAELGGVQLVVAHGLTEDLAVLGVLAGLLERGLHHADGAGRGLQSSVLEPGHLVVEPAAEAGLAADEVLRRHEPVLESDLIGVHAPVADRVDRSTLHLSAAVGVVLGLGEAVSVTAFLGDDEHRQTPVGLAAVGVGAGEQHEHVGAGSEGAPGLDAVDQPATLDGCGGDLDPGDVGAVVGLGHRHRVHDLGRGELRQPVLLLLLGSAGLERPGQDLGAGDQRAAGPERAPRELLGGDDHGDVVRLGAGGEAPVLLGDRESEGPHLGEPGDDLLGDVVVVAVDVLGDRGDLVLGEPAEGVLHHLEVVGQAARAVGAGERRLEGGGPVRGGGLAGAVQRSRGRTPVRFASEDLPGQVGQRLGGEHARDPRLDVSLGSVGQEAPRRSDAGGSMGDVVGQDLVLVDPAVDQSGDAAVDDRLGHVQGRGHGIEVGGGEVSARHGGQVTGR